jgi:hypothetical protein
MKKSWVEAMKLRLVLAELNKCHKGEGVNHYENCKWLAEKYLHMMREHRVCCFFGITFSIDLDALVGEGI